MNFYLPEEVIDADLYRQLISLKVDKYLAHLKIDESGFSTRTRDVKLHLDTLNVCSANIHNSSAVNILEIGAGFGRCALQIKKYFPNINYFPLVHTQFDCGSLELFKNVNGKFDILTEDEFNNSKIIDFLYYEIVDSIPFIKSNTIDFIFSIYTYNVIPRNDVLIRDLWRVLKIGGIAAVPYPMEYKYIGGESKYRFGTWAKIYDVNNNEIHYFDLLKKHGYNLCYNKLYSANIIKDQDTDFKIIIEPIMDDNNIVAYREIA